MEEENVDLVDYYDKQEEYIDLINMAQNTKEYIDLKNYYENQGMFQIIGMARSEKTHSNFLAWLLNPNSEHDLKNNPVSNFLCLIGTQFFKSEDESFQYDEGFVLNLTTKSIDIVSSSVFVEVALGQHARRGEERKRIDILLETKILFTDGNIRILPIIIENKVDSHEHNDQTNFYYNWGEDKYQNRDMYLKPIYVFLTPQKDIPINANFLKITYQQLVDFIIDPAIDECGNKISVLYMQDYLRCLSYTNIEDSIKNKENSYMAMGRLERELLRKFFDKNKALMCAVINVINEGDLPEGYDINTLRAEVVNRDYSKYEFEGKQYSKNRLVLAVVKKYYNENGKESLSFKDLEKVFPKEYQGSNGVVRNISNIKDTTRFFIDEPLKCSDGEILVCSQWSIGTIDNILNKANELGYVITKVNG